MLIAFYFCFGSHFIDCFEFTDFGLNNVAASFINFKISGHFTQYNEMANIYSCE